MQKISIEVLEKAMRADLSSAEVDMLLYIARYQDQSGTAYGIYYKDVCNNINISVQTFYDCRRNLEEKGIILAEKNNYYDWDITILDNSFAGKENYGRGYVSVASDMVKSKEFRSFRANAKLMALYLLREWQINVKRSKKAAYQILKENFLEKFKILGVSKRMIREYLSELEPFLSVYLENGRKYYLTFKREKVQNHGPSENDEKRNHDIDTACRRNRIKEWADKQRNDILTVLRQYEPKLQKAFGFDLGRIVSRSLEMMNAGSKASRWRRELNPALIHRLVQEELFSRAY